MLLTPQSEVIGVHLAEKQWGIEKEKTETRRGKEIHHSDRQGSDEVNGSKNY